MKKTLITLAFAAALPANANTFDPFSDILLFGDSLSDSGNVEALTVGAGGSWPYNIYPEGQFTNGDTWATQIGLAPSLEGGTNYAYGGARAAENGDIIPDLGTQISQFLTSAASLGANPLAAIWVGGNDFLDLPDAPTPADLTATIGGILTAVSDGITDLHAGGIRQFTVFGLPDFGLLPAYRDDPLGAASASFSTMLYNQSLQDTLSFFDAILTDADIDYFDVAALVDETIANVPPGLAGIRCLEAPVDCASNPTNYFFYDDIHPTEWVHAELANECLNHIAPIPLPASAALLLMSLAALGGCARRRK
ncbi:MAG: SGNH/GDSL hydrolase family protein [Boseongicola sp.]